MTALIVILAIMGAILAMVIVDIYTRINNNTIDTNHNKSRIESVNNTLADGYTSNKHVIDILENDLSNMISVVQYLCHYKDNLKIAYRGHRRELDFTYIDYKQMKIYTTSIYVGKIAEEDLDIFMRNIEYGDDGDFRTIIRVADKYYLLNKEAHTIDEIPTPCHGSIKFKEKKGD